MKTTIFAVIIGLVLIGGAMALTQNKKSTVMPEGISDLSNVTVTDGKQIVAITAKGGFSPVVSKAKASMPTILKIETKATFDCTSIVNIPALNYQENLPPTGVTQIDIPPQPAGSTLEGLCGMGMYRFEIMFE